MVRKQLTTSSTIKSIGYDPDVKQMEIEFLNGGAYRYHGVEQKHVNDLVNAKSVGQHFYMEIKDKFKTEKLTK